MSKFDEFADSARKIATKAVNETVRITDETASKVKIKAEEAKLCEKYEKLGREACGYFEDLDVCPENIAKAMDEIKTVKEKIRALEGELAGKKAKYAEKKADGEKKADTANAEPNEENAPKTEPNEADTASDGADGQGEDN